MPCWGLLIWINDLYFTIQGYYSSKSMSTWHTYRQWFINSIPALTYLVYYIWNWICHFPDYPVLWLSNTLSYMNYKVHTWIITAGIIGTWCNMLYMLLHHHLGLHVASVGLHDSSLFMVQYRLWMMALSVLEVYSITLLATCPPSSFSLNLHWYGGSVQLLDFNY